MTDRRARALKLVCIVSWLVATPLTASEARRSVALPRPDQPAAVTVRAVSGQVTVEGHDQPVVEIELAGAEETTVDRALRINESGNRVEIHGQPGAGAGQPIDLRLRVPRRTSLRIRTLGAEAVKVGGVSGQVEISNRLGDVEALGIVGSVVAESREGDVRVELLAVSPEIPTALSAFHGDVELTLPADLDAEMSLRSKRGTIESDFAIEAPVDQVESDPRIVLGKVGAGGMLISVKTYNGNIKVRSARVPTVHP